MLLISNEDGCGINALFPAVLGDSVGTIPVTQWDSYRKVVRLFVLLNLSFCLGFLALLTHPDAGKAQRFYEMALPVYFAYAFVNVKLCRKRVNISVRKGLNKTVAPVIVWLDYFLFGLSGVLLQSVSMKLDPDPLLRWLLIPLQIGFSFYALLPIFNYLTFLQERRKAS